jgi:hypothetical protein
VGFGSEGFWCFVGFGFERLPGSFCCFAWAFVMLVLVRWAPYAFYKFFITYIKKKVSLLDYR